MEREGVKLLWVETHKKDVASLKLCPLLFEKINQQ